MATIQAPLRYFLGSNTPGGFVSTAPYVYHPNDGWKAYLLKGGAGTGKSTLLRTLYEQAAVPEAEVFCCSGDPSSFDAVRFPKQKLCFMDATAPHTIEPRCWGVTEQLIPLSLATDEITLQRHRETILTLTEENASLHAKCRAVLQTVNTLLAENRRIAATVVDNEKVKKAAHRLADIEYIPTNHMPHEERRFLSAVTPEGLLCFFSTVQALCPKIYVLEDEYSAVTPLFLETLRKRAAESGQHCVVCLNPLTSQHETEHLLLPQLGVGIITSNSFHKVDFPVFRRIHASRFFASEALNPNRNRLSFNRRAANELLQQATSFLSMAKHAHDKLENFNATAADWSLVENITRQTVEKLKVLL